MKVSILTLGCKVNQSESTFIEGNLKRLGFSIVDLSEQPDYCIVNTCSVTSKSDYQSRQLIRRAKKAGASVIVTGCYSQLNPEDIKRIDETAMVINNDNKNNIINILSNNTSSSDYSFSNRARPYLKVQDGCNFSCTYCIVHKARGRSRSTTVSEILKRIHEYDKSGYNEVVLTGIHLGLYGYDLEPKVKLSYLIRTILNETNIYRVRLSSLEVKEIDEEIIDLMQESRVCKHLHIPLQSGDDDILKKMNRQYSSKEYLKTLETIFEKFPDIAFGTDIIVGFPGEGENEYENTKKIIEMFPFAYLHIFPFSPRPNTLASQMGMQTGSVKKKERVNELNAINIRKKETYMKAQTDKILDIVIEDEGGDMSVTGTSSNYLKVRTASGTCAIRSRVNVRVSGTDGKFLIGDPIDKM